MLDKPLAPLSLFVSCDPGQHLHQLPGHGVVGELARAYVRQGPTPTWKRPGTLQTQQPSRLNPPRPEDAGVGRALLESTCCRPGSDGVTQKREAQAMGEGGWGHGGRWARPPGDRPQQLPWLGPPPSPLLHVWDSDRVCRSGSWFLRGPLGIPCPQHPCPTQKDSATQLVLLHYALLLLSADNFIHQVLGQSVRVDY